MLIAWPEGLVKVLWLNGDEGGDRIPLFDIGDGGTMGNCSKRESELEFLLVVAVVDAESLRMEWESAAFCACASVSPRASRC